MWGFLSVSPSSTVGPTTPTTTTRTATTTTTTNTTTMTTTVNDDDRSTVQDISQRMQQMIDLQYEYMTTAETTITQTKATSTAAVAATD